jgi:hypothetical protein
MFSSVLHYKILQSKYHCHTTAALAFPLQKIVNEMHFCIFFICKHFGYICATAPHNHTSLDSIQVGTSSSYISSSWLHWRLTLLSSQASNQPALNWTFFCPNGL